MLVSQHTAIPPSAPAAANGPVTVVGPWRLIRLLGEGEWCDVYQATPVSSTSTDSANYAVKLPKATQRGHQHAAVQLQNEAFVGRIVSHPHLTCHLAAHVDRPPFFLVMPYQDGATLSTRLGLTPRLSLATGIWITRQIAEALAALHDAGWVHRDVKPTNVYLATNGHATLCDLGLACRLGQSDSFVGSPAFMPPEALRGAAATRARDVYGLGITLYQMVTGELPFPQQDYAELAAAHQLLRPRDVRSLRPETPARIAHLLQRMLAKEPLRRPVGRELIDWLVDAEIDAFALIDA